MRDRRHHRRTLIQHDNGMLRNRENAAAVTVYPTLVVAAGFPAHHVAIAPGIASAVSRVRSTCWHCGKPWSLPSRSVYV